jgi:hypothetical protein
MSVATGEILWSKDFNRIESDLVVDANRVVYVIARLSAATTYQVFGLKNGQTVSLVPAQGVATNSRHPLMLHFNKLLYYIGTDAIIWLPTAGPSTSAAWPMARHDQERSARKPVFFLPD